MVRRRSIAQVEGVGEGLKKHGDEKCRRQIVVTRVSQTRREVSEKCCAESVEENYCRRVEEWSQRTVLWFVVLRRSVVERGEIGEVGNVLGEGLENGAYQRFEAATSGLEVGKVEVFWRCVATRLETRVFGSWPIEWVSASQDGGGCMVKVEALRWEGESQAVGHRFMFCELRLGLSSLSSHIVTSFIQ